MIDLLRPGDDQDPLLFERARDWPLVVLDDLGVTPLTAFVEERLYIIIDRRYRKHLPTIVTTNKEPGTLAGPSSLVATVGERIYWRLIERSERVYCGGADKNLRRH
jgi:DNA replication protein DnaC